MNKMLQAIFGQKKYVATIILAVMLSLVSMNSRNYWSSLKLFGPFPLTSNSDVILNETSEGVDVKMPFSTSGGNFKRYILKESLYSTVFSSKVFKVYPDDLVEKLIVNGKEVDLSSISKESLGDYFNSFVVDLSQYLIVGSNDMAFEFRNFNGYLGLSVSTYTWTLSSVLLIVLWASLLLWIWLLFVRFFHISNMHAILYLIITFGAVTRIWYVFTYNPVDYIGSDSQRHWEQGIDVLRLDLMSMIDPIGFQLYIGILAKLTLKIPFLIAFYTSILTLVGPWIWYRFLRELQGSKTLALSGWAFYSVFPSWISIYGYFMQETLMIPLLGAALWATWRCRRKGDLVAFLVMVVLWIMAGLTRGIAAPMAAVACTWLWCIQENRLRKAVYSTIILLFFLGPLTYCSYFVVNQFAPAGMGNLVGIYARSGKKTIEINATKNGAQWSYWFGSPSTGAKPFEPFSDWKTQRTGSVKVDVDLMKGVEDWDRAVKNIPVSFEDYLWITKENLIFLFFGPSWPDNNGSRLIDQLNIGSRFIWAPLFSLIILGLIIYRKRLKHQWMLPSVILMWFFVQGITLLSLSEGRYRKPFEGLAIPKLS